MLDVAQTPPGLGAEAVDIGLQPRLAVRQRQLTQILRPLEQQVEGEIDQPPRLSLGYRRLQGAEVRHVILVQGAQFAVDHRIGPTGRIRRQLREAIGPVQPLAGPQHSLAAADADLQSIAVELDLMRPTGR